ncbi:MAG: insulinase family protein [Rickettsia sp.]|nr:insulinase family protein [Rickettsia sp.]
MSKINFNKLNNNINYISCHDKKYLSVSIFFLLKINHSHNSKEQSGIAHFVEHMLFKGTKTKNYKELAQAIDDLGGDFNAYTTKEHIGIYTTIMKNNLHKALEIILDITNNSSFIEKEINKEKSIILQEIDNYYDNAEEHVFDNFFSAAYGNHYLGQNLLGSKNFISEINQESLLKYFKTNFNPQNSYICVVGDFESIEIKSQIENFFLNKVQMPNLTENNTPIIPQFQHNKVIYQVRDLVQSYFVIGFNSYDYKDIRKNYILQILNIILGGGFSSRLFQKFREELAIVYQIGSSITSYENAGTFKIHGACNIQDLNFLLSYLYEEINKILDFLKNSEIERAKNCIKTNIVFSYETTASIANIITYDYVLFNKYYQLKEVFDIIESITKQEILDLANIIFRTIPSYSILANKKIDLKLYQLQ